LLINELVKRPTICEASLTNCTNLCMLVNGLKQHEQQIGFKIGLITSKIWQLIKYFLLVVT